MRRNKRLTLTSSSTTTLSTSLSLWSAVGLRRLEKTWSAGCLLCGIISLSCYHFVYAINGPTPSLSNVVFSNLIGGSTQGSNDYHPLSLIRINNTININNTQPIVTSSEDSTYHLIKQRIHYRSVTAAADTQLLDNFNMTHRTTVTTNHTKINEEEEEHISKDSSTTSSYTVEAINRTDFDNFLTTTRTTSNNDGHTFQESFIIHSNNTTINERGKDLSVEGFNLNGSLVLPESNRTFYQECLSNRRSATHLITLIMYTIVCVIGLCGNTLVIYVVLRFTKMQTVTNIYILNLAIADECFLIGIPFLLYTMNICSWNFGEYMCKFYMISTSITQFTSSIFLLIMAADRYIAVCHPIESQKYRTINIAKLVSAFAWLASAILMLPVVLFSRSIRHKDNSNVYSCNIDWPEDYRKHTGTTFTLYTFLLGFAIPLSFILIFYFLVIRKLHSVQQKHKSKDRKRSNRKVTRLVLTVIAVYVLCWLPHWTSQVFLIVSFSGHRELARFEILLFLLFGCLAYSNSAMNPVLYAFLSDNFRKSFSKAFTCVSRQNVNAQLLNEPSLYTQKRTNANAKSRPYMQATSKRLSALKRTTTAHRESLNHRLLSVPATKGNIQMGDISLSELSGISGASASTNTTFTDKSSHSAYSKTTTTTELNGNLVDNNH